MSKVVKIGDIASLKTGPFGTQFSAKEYTSEGIPVINVKNIGYGQVLENELDYILESTRDRLSEHILKTGDIVFGRKGSVDRHAYISENYNGWVQGSDCIRLRFQEDVNTRYISHYLKLDHVKKQINHASIGSTMASLNTDILKNIKIILPELSVQNSIESALSSLESKVDVNSKICFELEAMAKAIYDYWFVQFDFPDESGKPYRTSGGEMVWNEQLKREIPKGWEATRLGNICDFRNGINYDKDVEGDQEYRIINVRNISSASLLLNESELDKINLPSVQADKYLLSSDDIVIARSGTPGATRLLWKINEPTIFCGFIICSTPHEALHKIYLTYCLKRLEGTSATKTGGSILQNVSQDTLKNLFVLIPDREVLRQFNAVISLILEKFHSNIDEDNELTKLRDWLLPMLMNGQAWVE